MRWFAVVIDWLSACYIAAVAFLSVYTADGSLSLFSPHSRCKERVGPTQIALPFSSLWRGP